MSKNKSSKNEIKNTRKNFCIKASSFSKLNELAADSIPKRTRNSMAEVIIDEYYKNIFANNHKLIIETDLSDDRERKSERFSICTYKSVIDRLVKMAGEYSINQTLEFIIDDYYDKIKQELINTSPIPDMYSDKDFEGSNYYDFNGPSYWNDEDFAK